MFHIKHFRKEIKKTEWMKVRKDEFGDFILQLRTGFLNEQQNFDFKDERLRDEGIRKLSEAIIQGKCS